jgi:uncharacterized protein YaeQ
MPATFDPKCYDLAAHFLADHPSLNNEQIITELADFIQTAIEDFITEEETTSEEDEDE